jgi:MFS family permease
MYRWILLGALCLVYLFGIGPAFYGFGVALTPTAEALGLSRAQASLGYSLLALTLGLAAPLVAWLMGRIGSRWTIFVGGLVAAGGATLVATTSAYPLYLIGAGVLLGLGVAMQTILPGTTMVTNWFARRRSLAMGIFLTAGGLGGFIAAPTISSLIAATGTYRTAWWAIAVSGVIAGVIGLVFARDKPEDMGLAPDGVAQGAAAGVAQGAATARVYQTPREWGVGAALRTPTFWMIVAASSVFGLGLQIVNSQLVAHLSALGVTAGVAAGALGTMALLSAVSRLIGGPIGDRVEPRMLLAVGLIGQLAGALLLVSASDTVLVYTAVVVFGVGYGVAFVAVPSLIANYFGREAYPRLYGIRLPIATVVGAIGPVAAGLVFDAFGSYTMVFIGYAVLAGVAAVIAFLARPVSAPEPVPVADPA